MFKVKGVCFWQEGHVFHDRGRRIKEHAHKRERAKLTFIANTFL
jgi:hypothetical protein